MAGVRKHRPSPLQRSILILLASLIQRGTNRVRTRDLEHLLVQTGDRPVYGNNLRASCRRMEESGWLRTLRASNLQLAVELTEEGLALATSLLLSELDREEAVKRAAEVRILPLVRVKPVYASDMPEKERLVELEGRWHTACRADYVVRLAGSTCLQLWRADGQVTRLEGDPLQVARWLQTCHDAGLNVQVQINESHAADEGLVHLKNAEYPEGQAVHTAGIWYDNLLTVLRRHHVSQPGSHHRKAVVSPGRRQRDVPVQERFLALAATLRDTRDALTCDREEKDTRSAVRVALAGFGFSPAQLTTLLTTIVWPVAETEQQQRQQLTALLEELASRGIDGDRKKLMTLVFSPVRRPEETWRGRLQWLLGGELANEFRFSSRLTRTEAEPVLNWLEKKLGLLATERFSLAINWGTDDKEENG